ncbi:MAG: galactokinase [Bacteroidales bacterium]|jgi:galactokinase|nr:galactokinase [Bacteroidales bacterium]MDD2569928.1 galactokinase [Bacteroidales bacterium]MDD2813541.1 galactokinase [Bacteroidales bacterium]MDD3385610.1 galactokinase [Bacteroidales bacterium]MDD3810658.1 galactokinase [Bacteroidales bacterium]
MNNTEIINKFIEKYGPSTEDVALFFSPGRVNLIGEHTDYNGGYVFPCALSFGTYLAIRKSTQPVVRMATLNFDFEASIPIGELDRKIGDEWVNYPLGVINELVKRGFKPSGVDMLFYGNIPNKSGLSSSASIELVTGVAIDDLYQLAYDRIELVKIGRAAENNFVGVNCGIMDQFAVGMGKKNHAIYLNCDTLDYELVPMNISGYKLVIANTNKPRGLADSKYNERVAECQAAVVALQPAKKIQYLAELTGAEFTEHQHLIKDETVMRRARHAILENERTSLAVKALKSGDLKQFGQLMNDSHDSLRDDYEVTGLELDTLVAESRKIPGVIGSRMTGAGFGGCTVSLVAEEAVDELIRRVGPAYQKVTGLTAEFYVADIGDGAGRKV